jgi:flagellar biosynthesis/type III secretory pathway chaperone
MNYGNLPPPQPASRPAGPPDGRPSLDALIDIASRLITLLGQETQLLRQMKIKDIAALQVEKLALTRAYEARTRDLNEHSGDLDAVDQAIRDELRATVNRFEDAAKANAIAVHAAQEANQRLMQAIVDIVSERRGRTEGYAADGTSTIKDARPREGLALSLDERL